MGSTSKSNSQGVALILALIFLVAMAAMVAFMSARTTNHSRQVRAYVDFNKCLLGIESGFALARAELEAKGDGSKTPEEKDGRVGVAPSYDLTGDRPVFEDTVNVNPVSLSSMPEVEFFAFSYDWGSDGIDNNGDGFVDEAAENDYYSTYSSARANRDGAISAVRRAEEILFGSNVNIWDNAAFGGAGWGGKVVNGNISVRGSIHLLGNDLNPGDIALALSGTATIRNNYDGIPPDLKARVPPLPTTVVDSVTVETLRSKIRVKVGLVSMGGSSQIGAINDNGNDFKEMTDGVYVTDGWTGTSMDGDGNPTLVYSDNGYGNGYDLGDGVPFPTFSDDGGLDRLAYYLEDVPFVHSGDIEIRTDKSYYWNATTGDEVIDGTPGDGNMPLLEDLDPAEFYFWYESDADHLAVNGRIPIDGDLRFERSSPSDETINYSGKAVILAYDPDDPDAGDIEISVNLLTRNLDGTIASSYPDANLLGFMAANDLFIAPQSGASQLNLMGGFYAQNQLVTNKQTNIMGTLAGNYFDLLQVPDIFQVPALKNAWDPAQRMIGDGAIIVFSRVSWREFGVR